MSDKTLTWFHEGRVEGIGNRIGPAYYLDADYEAVAVRIDAATAPELDEAQFDIQADGVSIFGNQTPSVVTPEGSVAYVVSTKYVTLAKGETTEDDAEDFADDVVLQEGSWITCVPVKGGNGKDFSIHLEMDRV